MQKNRDPRATWAVPLLDKGGGRGEKGWVGGHLGCTIAEMGGCLKSGGSWAIPEQDKDGWWGLGPQQGFTTTDGSGGFGTLSQHSCTITR